MTATIRPRLVVEDVDAAVAFYERYLEAENYDCGDPECMFQMPTGRQAARLALR